MDMKALLVSVASGTPRSKDDGEREMESDFLLKPSPEFPAGDSDLVAGKRVSGGDAGDGLLDGQDCSNHT